MFVFDVEKLQRRAADLRFIRRYLVGLFLLAVTAVDATGTVLVVGEGDGLDVADIELLCREADDVLVRAHGLAGREVVSERSAHCSARAVASDEFVRVQARPLQSQASSSWTLSIVRAS